MKSVLCVYPFPLSRSHWGGSGHSASLLLPWMRNDMFCQLLMWLRLESLCCLVIWWCPGGELVAYLRPGRLGHVHYKLQMNSSTCCLNLRSGGCFFTLLNITLPFWKASELRFSLELLMSSHCLRMQSRAWQWRWPTASQERIGPVDGSVTCASLMPSISKQRCNLGHTERVQETAEWWKLHLEHLKHPRSLNIYDIISFISEITKREMGSGKDLKPLCPYVYICIIVINIYTIIVVIVLFLVSITVKS